MSTTVGSYAGVGKTTPARLTGINECEIYICRGLSGVDQECTLVRLENKKSNVLCYYIDHIAGLVHTSLSASTVLLSQPCRGKAEPSCRWHLLMVRVRQCGT